MANRLSAAQNARRQERPRYRYAIYLNGNHVKFLKAQGQVKAQKEFDAYLQNKGKSQADGYQLIKL